MYVYFVYVQCFYYFMAMFDYGIYDTVMLIIVIKIIMLRFVLNKFHMLINYWMLWFDEHNSCSSCIQGESSEGSSLLCFETYENKIE